MGLMDKVKSQASLLAEKAQEGAKVGQERLMQMQGKRQSDALLLELGGLTYVARAGRAAPGADDRIAEIVTQLETFEAEHGPVVVTPAVPPAGESGSYVPSRSEPASSGSPSAAHPADPTPAAPDAQPPGAQPPAASAGGIPTASYASDQGSAEDPPST
jgi:hypothetical protein